MRRVFILLIGLFFCGIVSAEAGVLIKSIQNLSEEGSSKVVIELSGPAEFKKNHLSNPDRIYFDLMNASIPKGLVGERLIGDGILKAIRTSQFNKDTVRVVVDLDQMRDFKAEISENPWRLVIDVFSDVPPNPMEMSPAKPSQDNQDNKEARSPIRKKQPIQSLTTIKTIVIDPGHGGYDTGAIGPHGLYEKDVVLDIAKRLKRLLNERYPYIRVLMTRQSDVFIPLKDRTKFANDNKADLFISIHANASPNRNARGIETYFLNWTDDEEAMRVAARENAISLEKMRQMQDEVSIILNDLARDLKRDESNRLAHLVQISMADDLEAKYKGIYNLGVKQALFYVLVGAKMPSILVETSFISNPSEEKRLSTEGYRERIAKAILSGIQKYVSPYELVKRDNEEPQP